MSVDHYIDLIRLYDGKVRLHLYNLWNSKENILDHCCRVHSTVCIHKPQSACSKKQVLHIMIHTHRNPVLCFHDLRTSTIYEYPFLLPEIPTLLQCFKEQHLWDAIQFRQVIHDYICNLNCFLTICLSSIQPKTFIQAFKLFRIVDLKSAYRSLSYTL